MKGTIKKFSVSGFKSIRELKDFELRPLNIFIGANGAGKSNLVQVFRMLMAIRRQNLSRFIRENGGADNFLHNGPRWTEHIVLALAFSAPASADGRQSDQKTCRRYILTPTVDETFLLDETGEGAPGEDAPHAELMVYHVHDTSAAAPMRRSAIVQDCGLLRSDGGNIAPFLLALRQEAGTVACYREIVQAIRAAMPFFDDFTLDVVQYGAEEKVRLGWRQRGSDFPMQPYHLSDGSIRFICLAAALLQPNPPSTIIIDEPELGLHPEAIRILGELMRDAAKRMQLIVATQSPLLLDQFSVEDIVVVRREDGQSVFSRLQRDDFAEWLEEYSVGDLWSRNVIQGGSTYE